MHHRHGDFGRRLSVSRSGGWCARASRIGWPRAAVGTTPKTIGLLMRTTGGLPHRSAPRSPLRLSVAEREEISREVRLGGSLRSIAAEVTRNGGRRRYRAWRSEAGAIERARRPRIAKLAWSARLRTEVQATYNRLNTV